MKNQSFHVFSLLFVACSLTACNTTNSDLSTIADDAELQSGPQETQLFALQNAGTLQVVERTITIDGDFSDWQAIEPAVYPNAVATSEIVNGEAVSTPAQISAAFDADWLYLRFGLGHVANLQGLASPMTLEIDIDGDPLTGVIRAGVTEGEAGLPGVDYVLVFSPRDAKSGWTGGVGATAYERGVGATTLPPYTLEPSFAPTYADDEVELRIRRHLELPGTNIRAFANPTFNARLVVTADDDLGIESSPPIAGTFETNRQVTTLVQVPKPNFNRPSGTTRVMSWNVERGNLFADPAPFARVIKAVNPHVICFQEFSDDHTRSDLQRWLEEHVRAPEGWDLQVTPDTGTAIATRLASVRTGPIEMPPLAPSTYPIRNTMLLVASEGRRIVVSSIHLKCCGRAGDKSDGKRIGQTEIIKQLIADAVKEDHATGILIMGDFNLVGSRAPLDILTVGTDLNGTNLRDIAPVRLHDNTNTTWRDDGQPFLPGRLDFALISDSTIKVRNSFLLDTELLPPNELDRLKLLRDDTTKTSDHLPMIVDLKW